MTSYAEIWNGIRWALTPVTYPPGSTGRLLSNVSCAGAGACTAVGLYYTASGAAEGLVERLGSSGGWSTQPIPEQEAKIFGISCPSSASCTATGFSFADQWTPAGGWGPRRGSARRPGTTRPA